MRADSGVQRKIGVSDWSQEIKQNQYIFLHLQIQVREHHRWRRQKLPHKVTKAGFRRRLFLPHLIGHVWEARALCSYQPESNPAPLCRCGHAP